MEKTSKELLQLEHKDLSSSFNESALLVCGKNKKVQEERKMPEGMPFTAPLPKSQVLGKVKDFLGVMAEANKTLQLNAKDKPEAFDIEVLQGNESEYIELDLMLGVADLHTPEAMAAAEAAMAGKQQVVDLNHINGSSSDSESSSDDDDDEDDSDDDENEKGGSSTGKSDMQVDGSLPQQSESRTKRKRPKIVELP